MIAITTGDMMPIYGSFGLGIRYTVRLVLRLADRIDEKILSAAAAKTQQRYPYLSLRLRRGKKDFYFEENVAPIAVINTDKRISLNSEETNYHVWAVCYKDDMLFFEIYHGVADGTGVNFVLSTLLYYYCAKRYGVTDHTGIRTLEDPILPEESTDPTDDMPQLDPSLMQEKPRPQAFSLLRDGGLTASEQKIYDLDMPEDAFVTFSSAHDASPGTMVSILFARALDAIYPNRAKPLINSYIINDRPMLGALSTHHNCVHAMTFEYSDRVKSMPLDRQCTVHRGTTFVNADPERVAKTVLFMSSRTKLANDTAPDIETQKQAFAKMLSSGRNYFTYMVSYVGQWKLDQLAPYVQEFRVHAPNAKQLLIMITAINRRIFLSIHQHFSEDVVVKSFFRQLEDNHIPYKLKGVFENDAARFPEP